MNTENFQPTRALVMQPRSFNYEDIKKIESSSLRSAEVSYGLSFGTLYKGGVRNLACYDDDDIIPYLADVVRFLDYGKDADVVCRKVDLVVFADGKNGEPWQEDPVCRIMDCICKELNIKTFCPNRVDKMVD